ncbi:MAG: zf-HC2 domain-containing protein [Chloroflexi bacterium]|nr:zf-HC2 domain-containing protein [Chloroflexota bacterium]
MDQTVYSKMMNQEHVLPLLADYVLDLLPGNERRQVEQHAADCADCRQALHGERQIGGLVRATLHTATEPAYGRLTQLRPAVPQRATQPIRGPQRQRQLALAGLLLVLLLGASGWRYGNARQSWQPPPPTHIAITATTVATTTIAATTYQEATATLAQATTNRSMEETAVAAPSDQPTIQPHATPLPQATPIAAARPSLSAN